MAGKKHAGNTSDEAVQESAYIVHPVLKSTDNNERDDELALAETEGLARAIHLDIDKSISVNLSKIRPSTYLGKGQSEEIAKDIKELKPNVAIVNTNLSPVQQRNLEKAWSCKVIDRTGLILEIFGERAQTKEGVLQVELAALEYQRSRLVRSWTHLERQRGATGFIGGPGETQIEIDRRLIGERITKLKSELENVRRTRDLGRKSRQRVPLPVVSLVGYTNAGKSTLFNTLTGSDVFAKDLLFATLDPTMRRLVLPNNQKIVLSDTVGFISDLPTHLIAAFRATLEQAVYSDVIVHVMDVSRENWKQQRDDVINILEDLGIEYENDQRVFELYNKVDLIDEDDKQDLIRDAKFSEHKAVISALNGEGTNTFLENVAELLASERQNLLYSLPIADGKALSWLYDHADVIKRTDTPKSINIEVTIELAERSKFEQQFGYHAAENLDEKEE
ncbi:MAG: GTPase HflX [Pseudomonadota bacterium]